MDTHPRWADQSAGFGHSWRSASRSSLTARPTSCPRKSINGEGGRWGGEKKRQNVFLLGTLQWRRILFRWVLPLFLCYDATALFNVTALNLIVFAFASLSQLSFLLGKPFSFNQTFRETQSNTTWQVHNEDGNERWTLRSLHNLMSQIRYLRRQRRKSKEGTEYCTWTFRWGETLWNMDADVTQLDVSPVC